MLYGKRIPDQCADAGAGQCETHKWFECFWCFVAGVGVPSISTSSFRFVALELLRNSTPITAPDH